MKSATHSPKGLWQACANMEEVSQPQLLMSLEPFSKPVIDCYEVGVQAPTLKGKRHRDLDITYSALFLKRALTDLRVVWKLLSVGYTSQAAVVAAALFEHALVVNSLAGSKIRLEQYVNTESGDIPWGPKQLANNLAEQERREAIEVGRSFSNRDFKLRSGYVYASYKYLCKIKHPTFRSSVHDAGATQVRNREFSVMAAPDIRPEDLSQKVVVLMISLSRILQAVRHYALAMECDFSEDYTQAFWKRLLTVEPNALSAAKSVSNQPLPFNIRDTVLHDQLLQARLSLS